MDSAAAKSSKVSVSGLAVDVYQGLRNQLVTAIATGIGAAAVAVFSHLWLQRNWVLPWLLPVSGGISLIAAGAALGSIITYRRFKRELESKTADANTDLLTGLLNSRALKDELASKILEANSTNKPLSMIIIDLDNFKSVNDAGGYELGDAVLGEFAARLKEQCRGIDRVFRYKMGDEFLILAPDTPATPGARGLANRLRNLYKEYTFKGRDGFFPVTFSAGVADTEPASFPDDTAAKFLARAESALKAAKRKKNTFEIFEAHPESAAPNTPA